jgi:hypothetical protein
MDLSSQQLLSRESYRFYGEEQDLLMRDRRIDSIRDEVYLLPRPRFQDV